MVRRTFFSFHYEPDAWRAAQVRNMGMVDGNRPVSDNDWETVKKGGDRAIKEWIDDQMHGRSCTVVLVGSNTADRKWINYEIDTSWKYAKGVVGIYIHGLENQYGETAAKGDNPFNYIDYSNTGKKLSSIVERHNPSGSNSQERYAWIKKNLADIVQKAISGH